MCKMRLWLVTVDKLYIYFEGPVWWSYELYICFSIRWQQLMVPVLVWNVCAVRIVPSNSMYLFLTLFGWSRDSVVGIATGYGLDDRGVVVRVPVGSRFSSSPCHPDRLWGPPSLLSNSHGGLFPRGWSGRDVKLTTHLQLVPRSRKCGSIHPLPHTPSWWSTGTTLPLPLLFLVITSFVLVRSQILQTV
jgi:hypothetical protein